MTLSDLGPYKDAVYAAAKASWAATPKYPMTEAEMNERAQALSEICRMIAKDFNIPVLQVHQDLQAIVATFKEQQ